MDPLSVDLRFYKAKVVFAWHFGKMEVAGLCPGGDWTRAGGCTLLSAINAPFGRLLRLCHDELHTEKNADLQLHRYSVPIVRFFDRLQVKSVSAPETLGDRARHAAP